MSLLTPLRQRVTQESMAAETYRSLFHYSRHEHIFPAEIIPQVHFAPAQVVF